MRFSNRLARSAVATLIATLLWFSTSATEGLAAPTTTGSVAATYTAMAVAPASGQATSAAPAASPLSPKGASSPAPEANPADVASIDAILHAAYDTISGPAGKQRDWNRFRSLFAAGARLIPTIPAQEGGFTTRVLTPEDYITHGDAFFAKNGFFEREVARRTEEFGQIAQVFSTYESRHNADDAKPFERGINSFQLMNDGKRWRIVTILWQGETPQSPIPKEYLSGGIADCRLVLSAKRRIADSDKSPVISCQSHKRTLGEPRLTTDYGRLFQSAILRFALRTNLQSAILPGLQACLAATSRAISSVASIWASWL